MNAIAPLARALRRLNPSAQLALLVVAITLVVALFPAAFATADPYTLDLPNRLLPPDRDHIFGTDNYGRDVFSRVLHGARYSLFTALVVVAFGLTLGCAVGVSAAASGGWFDEILMRLTDVVLAFPPILLAMVVVTALKPSLEVTMLTLVLIGWPEYARVMRAQALVVLSREFVLAARALGIGPLALLTRHVLPNALPPLIVLASLNLGIVILSLAALGFLGLGAGQPTPEWGRMVSDGRDYFLDSWWYPVYPGLAIALLTLAFNILGDTLRDILDPTTRRESS
ncbi:MAG: ABC transporter permease [Anaerolineaceae bacterium]|nr:ABC transporter permease [Anaerolineaceae bacterium]MCY3934779.1 ABC transporter permease [Chloroflexota bacterium]MCY4105958.1 ABC transporter permease [Chloroflexota bacterium]